MEGSIIITIIRGNSMGCSYFSELNKYFLPTKEIFHGIRGNSNFVLMPLRGRI